MAITILDVDTNQSPDVGKNPIVTFDFNPTRSANQVQKRYRLVTGRLKAYDGDTLSASDVGLSTIRSFVATPVTAYQLGGSLSNLGSANNSVTLSMKQTGTTTALGSFGHMCYVITGDR